MAGYQHIHASSKREAFSRQTDLCQDALYLAAGSSRISGKRQLPYHTLYRIAITEGTCRHLSRRVTVIWICAGSSL